MRATRYRVDITTDGSGNATVYAPQGANAGNLDGRVLSLHYVKDGTTPFSNGVDLTVTSEATGEPILTVADMNASADYYPRSQTQDVTAAGNTYDGTHAVTEPVVLANDRVKLVISSGGANKLGRIDVVIG
jgi:hypothetical protein